MDHKTRRLNRFLAIGGDVLVWFPVVAALVFAVINLVSTGKFMIDYLFPAELGLGVLIGGAAMVWAAIRSRVRVKWICWTFGVGIVLLLGSQGVAMATGLASGAVEPTGWQFALTIGMLLGYDLCVILLGVGGILLILDLSKPTKK
jgi:hypothetical protein